MSCAGAGDFGDTWYLYCGPAVFVCAVTLLTLAKNWLNARPLPGIACIARHSLGIYRLSCPDSACAARQPSGAIPLAAAGYCVDI